MPHPAHLRYSAEHEWFDPAQGAVGITSFAADSLGDVVYLDLPAVGATVSAGEVCGEVESTKSVSELYAPVSGEVLQVNSEAVDDPSLVNADPYATWLFKVRVVDEGELLSAEEYEAIAQG